MNWLHHTFFRLQSLFLKKRIDEDLNEEIGLHLEMQTDANIAAGMSPEEARHAARREFGGVEQIKESYRDERGIRWLEQILQDFRFALRQLRKNPGFSAVSILTLALAIGVNSAVFSFIDRIHLRPVIKDHPEEVVNVFTASKGGERKFRMFSYAEHQVMKEAKEVFSNVAAFQYSLCAVGRSESLRRSFIYYTSSDYFSLLGVQPFRGRFFSADETRPRENTPVVVASYALWERLGGADDFIGSQIRINDTTCTVIGIAPKGFGGTTAVLAPEAWLPLGMADPISADNSGGFDERRPSLLVFARMRAGLTLAAAQAITGALEQRLNALSNDSVNPRELVLTMPSRSSISSEPQRKNIEAVIGPLALVMAASVLLVASLNLANLLLARGSARRQEIAIRMSLGASRNRVVRQLAMEGLLLALAGATLGLFLGIWANDLLLRSLVEQFHLTPFSVALDLSADSRVLFATLAYCIGAVLVFSIVPAWRSTRVDLASDLKMQNAASGGSRLRERFFSLRQCLVMGQIALSLMLLACTGLFLRSMFAVGHLDLGFDTAGQLIAETDYNLSHTPSALALTKQRALVERARGVPSVEHAALATQAPYSAFSNNRGVHALNTSEKESVSAIHTAITATYFSTMGVPLLLGRDFTDEECFLSGGRKVAIIDQTLANKLFGDRNPLGERVKLNGAKDTPEGMEIVGVVRSPRHFPIGEAHPKRIYLPLAQATDQHVYLHVRLQDTAALVSTTSVLRRALNELDPANPILFAMPTVDFIDHNMSLSGLRLAVTLFTVFGTLSLALSVIGVYGVKAFLVTRRTHEIGVRMALGARPGQVLALILRQGAYQTTIALLIGLMLALGAGRVIGNLLLNTKPTDPIALGGAAAVLALSVFLASWLPARRAAKVDPMVALRCE